MLADFAKRRGITFPLLSDPDSRAIKAYGILNTTVNPSSSVGKISIYGIPFPGTIIVNAKGVVSARRFEEAYQERVTTSVLLGMTGSGKAPVARHTTDQLEIRASASDETISAGTLFSLVLEVKPLKGMHVYAQGAKDYRAIGLRLEPAAGLKLHPMTFPRSEIYHFAPLNERVPVYRKPFKLVQELSVDMSRDGQALLRGERVTIKGFVDYQACSDRVCFPPASVPVEWTFSVRKLDIERSTPRQ